MSYRDLAILVHTALLLPADNGLKIFFLSIESRPPSRKSAGVSVTSYSRTSATKLLAVRGPSSNE
jgi:hypothetical protein